MANTPQHNGVAESLNCPKVSSSVLFALQLTDTLPQVLRLSLTVLIAFPFPLQG